MFNVISSFQVSDINHADTSVQQTVTEFIEQTRLANRNQVILTLEQSLDDGLNIQLRALMESGRTIMLDPFRSITGDKVVKLLTTLINTYNRNEGTAVMGVSDIALDLLLTEKWEYNYVQFYLVLNLALAAISGPYIAAEEIRHSLKVEQKKRYLLTHTVNASDTTLPSTKQTLAEIMQDVVIKTLALNHNNRTRTAQQLGISRATLWRYLKHD